MRPTLRDIELIDAIEALPTEAFKGDVFRLVRDGRYPTDCWHPKGRWDDGEIDVRYTLTRAEGALAEVRYHLSQQPFVPDFLSYRMFRIPIDSIQVVNLLDRSLLQNLGIDLAIWGKSEYISRGDEYVRSQQIAAVAAFHEREGMLVPSVRSPEANIVILTQECADRHCGEPEDLGLVQL